MFTWLLFALCLAGHGDGAFAFSNYRRHLHLNTCDEITSPYKRVADFFLTADYVYFPGTYKEKVCKQDSDPKKIATCAGGMYHCVTRYDKQRFIKIPVKNMADMSKWDEVTIVVAIGCQCLT